MSLLRADKIANKNNNSGPIICGPSTVSGNFVVTGIATVLGLGVTNSILVGQAVTTKYLTASNGANLFNSNLTGITTAGIITQATYFGDGVNLSGIVTQIVAGTGINISPSDGKGRVTINANNVPKADFATNAGLTTDIKGGQAGVVVYQADANETAFTAVGQTGQVLQSNHANAPTWVSISQINVAYADSAGIATDIKGGSAGRLLIQTAPDNTDFLPVGPSGNVLLAQGTSNPIYIDPKAQLDVRYARLAGITTNLDGGYIKNGTTLQVTGLSTFGNNVNITGNLDVDGTTELDGLNVDGTTTLDDLTVGSTLSVSGVSTFTGFATATGGMAVNGGLTADSAKVSDLSQYRIVIAGAGGELRDDINLTFNGSTLSVGKDLDVDGYTDLDDLVVSGITTLGFTTVGTEGLYVSGISSIGSGISMFPTSGIVSAIAFYGDGSNLTNVSGAVSVTNILYVTVDGNDENDGFLISSAKRTVGSALTIADESTVIKIFAGNYTENNPIILPEQVTLLGDSLREVSIIPQNPDKDLIYVSNGNYVENMSFTGTLDEGKAIIAFNPDKPSYVTQGPYIRNCTNFISNSIGMKIDGRHVIGDTRAMNVDSYTQLNQGGIGVSISNEGYAQLVSIFTIYNDQSIVCIDGGQCDLTNSNSSFGRLGLVADGLGPQIFIGTITEAKAAETDIFEIDCSVDNFSISGALYDNVTGLTTITTSTDHGFNVGMSVTMKDMTFTCDSQLPVTSYNVSNAIYNEVSGIMTVTTTVDNNFYVGASVTFAQLTFNCDSGGGASNGIFPPAPGDNNGAARHVFDVLTVGTSTEFTVNVGPSTIAHTYVSGGNVSISTFAPFPSGAYGNIFTVDSVVGPTTFTAYVGASTLPHTYVSGGDVETFVTRPYDGQVVYLDALYNSISGVTITNGGSDSEYTNAPNVTFSAPSESWGITATGVARLTNGKVSSVDMISNGRGYTGTPTVTIDGSATGTCDILPTYYVVSSATPIVGGISTVTFTERVPYAVGVGTTVPFFKQSRVLASSHAFEYIGSGNTALSALPQRGGVAIPENETTSINGGLVIYTSTDQAGNFKIGDGVIINQLEGSISGDAYQRSLFANITPYILALGGID